MIAPEAGLSISRQCTLLDVVGAKEKIRSKPIIRDDCTLPTG
jgi:hypothetical protein